MVCLSALSVVLGASISAAVFLVPRARGYRRARAGRHVVYHAKLAELRLMQWPPRTH